MFGNKKPKLYCVQCKMEISESTAPIHTANHHTIVDKSALKKYQKEREKSARQMEKRIQKL